MDIRKSVKHVLQQSWLYPVFLFLVGLISYVVSLPELGFYWDDWQAVFLYQGNSVEFLRQFFLYDRPFSAWTYELTFPVLPMSPIIWQLFTMLTRCVAVWALVAALIRVWREHAAIIRWTGLLLMVFPGFTMQSISVAFNQHFITLMLFCLSIYWMVKGVLTTSKIRWLWLGLSLLTALGQILTMEYFIGLELIRPVILWYAIRNEQKNVSVRRSLTYTLAYFLPYFFILVGFVFWRTQVYPTQFVNNPAIEAPNNPVLLQQLFQSPIKAIIKLGNLVLQDSVFLLTQNWQRALDPASIRVDASFYILSWVVGLVVAGLYLLWSLYGNKATETPMGYSSYRQLVVIGLLTLLLGGLPVWITDRQILAGKWSDRFSLAPMIGAVLLLVVLIDWIIRTKKQKNIVLLLFLGLSIAFQMRTTHKYALDWEIQKNFYWQLYWRVPAVKPGTAFFSASVPSTYSSHFSAGFSHSVLYDRLNPSTSLSYWYFSPKDEGKNFYKLAPDYEINYQFRNLVFKGSTSNVLAYMYKPASGCLILLDQAYSGNPASDSNHNSLIPLTNPDRIILAGNEVLPDRDIFGEEPQHDWCFYFEKADLARQEANWSEVLELMQEAQVKGLSPKSGVEKLPALEARFYQQDWQPFVEISRQILAGNAHMNRFLCVQWDRMESESGSSIPADIHAELKTITDCSSLSGEGQ